MRRILLFLSFILMSVTVFGQTPLANSVPIYVQLQPNPDLSGGISLNGNGFSSAPFSAPGSSGPILGSSANVMPPIAVLRGGNQISAVTSSNAYPVRTNVDKDILFHGSFSGGSNFSARYAVEMIAPAAPTFSPTSPAQVCATAPITLTSANNWPLMNGGEVTMSIVWEYNIQGTAQWKGLDTSNGYSRTLIPSQHIPELATAGKSVSFRCKQKAEYSDVTYYSPASSGSAYRAILPAPPQVDMSKVKITASCFGNPKGKIEVPAAAITAGFSTMRWNLRTGDVTVPCDPLAGNCGSQITESAGTVPVSGGITITNLAGGATYTLWIFNPGGEAGNCITPVLITVPQLTDLTVTNNTALTTPKVSCFGYSNGRINLTASGANGAVSGYFFTLTDMNDVIIRPEQQAASGTVNWTGLPANKYKALVRDGTCADGKVLTIEITQDPQMTAALDVTQPSCIAEINGSIKATASADATDHYYTLYKNGAYFLNSGTTPARSYTFNNLGPGSYYVQTGTNTCPTAWQTAPVTLNAATPLALQLVSTDSVSCNGGSDGTLKVSGSGGSGSYQYTLGATTNTSGQFNGLAAGNYIVTIKNQGTTCTDVSTKTFTVSQRKPIQVALQKTDISCNAANNGIINATVQDGSGSYQYTWQQFKGGTWVTNSFWFSTDTKITGLEPGMYRVIITDAKASGCTVTSAVVTLTEPAQVAITGLTVTDAVCLAEGALVNMTASGGDANFTYKWSLDGNTFTAFTAGNALHTAGTYTFSVTDGKGCTAISAQTYAVTLPDAELSFTSALSGYNGFNISCTGTSDGRIEVTAQGGDPTYQYKLNTGAYQSANVFDQLAAGNYTLSVKDGRGCIKTANITLTQPAIMIKAGKTDILCYGAATGNITTNISGGAAPYSIQLNRITVSAVMPNLPAGDYNLHITDANGCTKDSLIKIVHLYPALKIETATVNDIVCYGSKGSITLQTTGGDGTWNYGISADDWNTAAPYTSAGALGVGNYSIRVTDGKGCIANFADHLPITSPAAPLTFTASLSDYNGYNISCSGGNNGFAGIQAAGGSGVYTYALDNGTYGSSALLEHINAGSHTLRVKDERGCITSSAFTFTQSSQAITIALLNKNDVICAATPAGNITVAGSGGVGALEYSIDNTNWQSTTSFYNLPAGTYTIMVKDANSCSTGIQVPVNSQDPAIVIDNVTLNDIVCYEGKGTVNIQVHGGAGALINEYSLDGGAYTAFNNTTPLGVGTYKVRVKDGPGCYSALVDAGMITSPAAALTAALTTSDFNGMQISCNGLTDGSFAAAPAGGGSNYQYSFNNGAYTGISSYDHLSAGNYSLKIKDDRGCVITKNVLLQQAGAMSLTVAGIENLSCGADPTGKITLQAGGGVIPYQYDLGNDKWQETPVFASLRSGSYNLQVKDKNGCIAVNNAVVDALNPAITALADITPVNCYGENNGAVKVNISGGDGQYTYEWNGVDPQQLKAGNYTLKVTDGKGCFQSFSYTVPQPDLLTLATTAPAVCDGLSDGSISAAAQGGVTPYQYALDQGAWGISPVFEKMAAGSYRVKVQDANGCNVSKDLVIEKANIKPDVNFLVASRRNALDTLVIKEISFPAPDKVSWTYSPEAVPLGQGMIKFSQPGNYWVQMTATFGSCTYSLKKDVQVSDYDPLAGPVYTMPVHVIDTLILSPNPNNGYFSFQVKMIKKQQAVVNVYDMNGRLVDSKQYSPSLLINDTFSLSNSISGTYLLRVIAENDSRDLRFIISR